MTGTILLVEDDEPLRSTLARHLRADGYEVVESDSAEDAVASLGQGLRPDLLILDINLPGDTGWSLLRDPALAAAGDPPVRGRRISAQTVRPRDADLDDRAPRPAGAGVGR